MAREELVISPFVTHWAAFLAGWAGCATVWWLALRSGRRKLDRERDKWRGQ